MGEEGLVTEHRLNEQALVAVGAGLAEGGLVVEGLLIGQTDMSDDVGTLAPKRRAMPSSGWMRMVSRFG